MMSGLCTAVSYTHLILRTGSREGNSLDLADSLLALGSPGDGLLGLLHHSLDDFTRIKGVGKVKGVQLLCIGELSKRIWKRKASEHTPVSYTHLADMGKVIGKQGRIAKAIRSVVKAAASKEDKKVIVEIQ